MPEVKLKFEGGERIVDGTVSIGRTPDNTISFPDDPNISRNHVEIEKRGDYYCLIELGSRNGTTINGQPVNGEIYLWDGAEILLGNSVGIEVVFLNEDGTEPVRTVPAAASPAVESAGAPETAAIPATPSASGSSKGMLIAAGAVFGAALIFAAGVTVYFLAGPSSGCNAAAAIVKPEPGDTIIGPTEIELDISGGSCVERVVFAIDGIEVATADSAPFTTTIDPKEFPEFSDGFDHGLTVELEDEEGNRLPAAGPVLLAFETRAVTKPKTETEVATAGTDARPERTGPAQVSLIEIHEMSKRMIRQFPGSANHNVSNRQFLQEVQRKTAEFARGGYFERAARYRDAINVAFVREQNLDAPLGFYLAMSRSNFNAERAGTGEGLWRLSDEFATANGYKGLCGSETLSEASQNCAAKATAIYLKALVFGVFDGDPVYSVAVFGRSPQEAAEWKASLTGNRADLWNTIRTPAEREQIVRFFAAGIVAENPQKFGLDRDRPISELFRIAM